VEAALARQFGACLTSVREALMSLESEGFITKKPNAATLVTRLNWEEVSKISQRARRVREGLPNFAEITWTPNDAGSVDSK
jgi:DNA-binding GntR family transcriptional regulator